MINTQKDEIIIKASRIESRYRVEIVKSIHIGHRVTEDGSVEEVYKKLPTYTPFYGSIQDCESFIRLYREGVVFDYNSKEQ